MMVPTALVNAVRARYVIERELGHSDFCNRRSISAMNHAISPTSSTS